MEDKTFGYIVGLFILILVFQALLS